MSVLIYADLPIPKLGSLIAKKPDPIPETEPEPVATLGAVEPVQEPPTPKPLPYTRRSFGAAEADPWGNPLSPSGKGHANGTQKTSTPKKPAAPYTVASQQATSTPGGPPTQDSTSGPGWEGFGTTSGTAFRDSGLSGRGFGEASGGDNPQQPSALEVPFAPRILPSGAEEVITVNSLPEKEGMFLFQHRNYQVSSARRSSKVIRRYSDFVWLLDCLHKRYPFRQLPLLPPKRVASEYCTPVVFCSSLRKCS
jgi:sorting nexin-8